jgi:ADP-ribose pyrophosphatase YjhB (NUDIX family)
VGALIFEDGKVLLVERGREPLAGYWSLPGGCVETGERLEEAVAREVLEETGLGVAVDSVAAVFERVMPDTAGQCEYHYVLVDFYCSPTGEGNMQPGDDSSKVEWFALDQLPSLRLTEGTLDVINTSVERKLGPLYVTRP